MSTPTPTPSTEAIASPENTRMVVAPIVVITDSKADGPSVIDLPTCQRVAVLKNLPWSAIEPMKMCGGGSSFGSAQPTAHSNSQMPTNRPIDRIVQPILAAMPSPAMVANRRATAAGRDVPAADDPAEKSGGATTAIRPPTCT